MNTQISKDLSAFLAKNLKDKNVKQSELLELMASFNGFPNWNTYQAVNNKPFNIKESHWTKECHIHIDNGGVTFAFSKRAQTLYVASSFFGYTNNEHFFSFTAKEVQKMLFQLKEFMKGNFYDEKNAVTKPNITGEGWVVGENGLTLSEKNQIFSTFFMGDPDKSDEIEDFMEDIKKLKD